MSGARSGPESNARPSTPTSTPPVTTDSPSSCWSRPTTTIATSAAMPRPRPRRARSDPEAVVIRTPGSASRSPCSGETVDGRPDARRAVIAEVRPRPPAGRRPRCGGCRGRAAAAASPPTASFFSSTIDSAATRRASARCAGEAMTSRPGSSASRVAACSRVVRRMRCADSHDRRASDSARPQRGRQLAGAPQPQRHLDVHPGLQAGDRVVGAEHPVARHEPGEAPLVPQHVGEQRRR